MKFSFSPRFTDEIVQPRVWCSSLMKLIRRNTKEPTLISQYICGTRPALQVFNLLHLCRMFRCSLNDFYSFRHCKKKKKNVHVGEFGKEERRTRKYKCYQLCWGCLCEMTSEKELFFASVRCEQNNREPLFFFLSARSILFHSVR